jgi:hypothetical protein
MIHKMSNEKLDADIKTRVPQYIKDACQEAADERHLDLSDIVREALREFVAKRRAGKPGIPQEATL